MFKKEDVGKIGQYGGEIIDLMEVALNQEFWVCNGGYDAYVIEEEGQRYIIIPDAPDDNYVKQPITDNRRYDLQVTMSNRKNADCRHIECDCCGRRIRIGSTIHRMKGSDYLYCSRECFIQEYDCQEKLTVKLADECSKELTY